MDSYKEIERSIIKKYRKEIWSKFVKGVKEYKLINEHDKIAVCISGGKDSFLLVKLMQEIKLHGDIDFDLEFIVMNPGYNEKNKNLILENAKRMNIPIHMFESDIFKVVANIDKNPCYLCARMRRGCLYGKAIELGCNKIALGHHFDDVIETILMSTLYGGEFKTMMPKLHSTNHKGIELIRPMYFIREKDIISWAKYNKLNFLNCACRFTEMSEIENNSKRKEIKELILELKKVNPNVDINIFKSICNVNLTTILGYHDDDNDYNFLDNYEEE